MISKIKSATLIGLKALEINIEIDSKRGLPQEIIVGLPDAVIKESKARVKAAIKNSGFNYALNQYTINLAPAALPKEGLCLDLPIAAGLLMCNQHITLNETIFLIGELSLDGKLKPIKGMISIAEMISKTSSKKCIIPDDNKFEASLIKEIEIYPIKHLKDLINLNLMSPYKTSFKFKQSNLTSSLDYADVKGQLIGKKAMEIVAAGSHNILLMGPPGSGKSMLLNRLPSLLPELTHQECIDIIKLQSLNITHNQNLQSLKRPFKTPHHSISHIGLAGGGKKPLPGEISLANHGILFLDELPEFSKQALEILRQPLESKKITITRAAQSISYPANFLLVAAMNPCPCGYATDSVVECTCTENEKNKYTKKLSGPLLDRFDLIIEIPRLKKEEFSAKDSTNYSSKSMLKNIKTALFMQKQRYKSNEKNGTISVSKFSNLNKISLDQKQLLGHYIQNGTLTARSATNVIRIARTIADLENSKELKSIHISQALQLRHQIK